MLNKQQVLDIRSIFDSLLKKGYVFRKIGEDVVAYFSDENTLYFGVERYSDDIEIKIGFSEEVDFNESYSIGALYHTENNLELGALADYSQHRLLEKMYEFITTNYVKISDEEYCSKGLLEFREKLRSEL